MEGSARAEAERRLTDEAWDAMVDAELFGILAPRHYGGFELPITEAMDVWEAVARCDSAAAWNLVMTSTLAAFAAWLPEAGAREIFADGHGLGSRRPLTTRRGDPNRRRLADHWPSALRQRMPSSHLACDARVRDGWGCARDRSKHR